LQHAQQQFAFSTQTVKAARAAYQQAEAGHQEGQLAYLDLLAARQDVLSAERSQVLIRNQWLSASVAAYSQLSGGWSSQLISNL
jgi:multidrug efflux system outer membrane protein